MIASVRKNVVVMRRAAAQRRKHHVSSKGQNAPKDPRIGSKTPIPLGVTQKSPNSKPKSEKPMLSPQAELELLETDERLGMRCWKCLEAGETLSAEEQSWWTLTGSY